MDHLVGGVGELGWVALKALLLYLTAVLGFRVGQHRTLADLSPFDFVAAVAVGSIVGRVPNATTPATSPAWRRSRRCSSRTGA